MKGATVISSLWINVLLFQSTPPVKGATQKQIHSAGLLKISIHAPREGGDYFTPARAALTMSFQSTPPVKGATTFDIQVDDITGISIHAPREGGDPTPIHITNVLNYFNPRPP